MTSWLITGGSGTLGRALACKLLTRADATRVCIYSRGEHVQAKMRDEIADPHERLRWMIGDVRDVNRLKWAMHGIDVVIHAAALKRIEVGAYAPTEMVQTNVLGTMNVIDAAASRGVWKVVGVSSDKAWRPVSPYGLSKAMSERLLLAGNIERRGPIYAVCRYGNVSGSMGSVIPKWREILKKSKTKSVPVTDPSCTRFWMRLEEAVTLVLNTVDVMKTGSERQLHIPSLPAYQLGDLAKAMGAKQIDITGLPEWEKIHEGMADDVTSDKARRMSVEELRKELENV